jgi:hypothetical protein
LANCVTLFAGCGGTGFTGTVATAAVFVAGLRAPSHSGAAVAGVQALLLQHRPVELTTGPDWLIQLSCAKAVELMTNNPNNTLYILFSFFVIYLL